ncbi:MAG: hypothetical protein ABSB12_03770 [Candidatus Saccharimonadales bacterium]|jgi:hypothetical protein
MRDKTSTTDSQPAASVPIPNQTAVNPSLETINLAVPPEPEAILPPVVDQPITTELHTIKRSWLTVPIAMIALLIIVAIVALSVFLINRNNLTYSQAVPVVGAMSSSHQSKYNEETISVNCGSKNCFNQKFISCSSATESIAPTSGGTTIHYVINGHKDSGCNMQLTYTNSTISVWDNQPLVCNFDNQQPVNVAVAEALYTLSQNTNPYDCSGSFVNIYKTTIKDTTETNQVNSVTQLIY